MVLETALAGVLREWLGDRELAGDQKVGWSLEEG